MKIAELIKELQVALAEQGNIDIKIDGWHVSETGIVPGEGMFKPYFEITGR